MYKTIKFKAWDKSSKRMAMVKNTYGLADGTITYVDLVYLKNSPKKNLPIGQVVLLQFTNFLDINGKEIYEGDIVELTSGDSYKQTDPYLVEDIQEFFCLFNESDSYYLMDETKTKLLGNIYENPELMRK